MARNLTDAFDGILRAPIRYVLLGRDTKFTAQFQAILRAADVIPILLPPKSPNCSAHIERFFRSLKGEALSRIIFFGETALRNATAEFILHYHGERAHQGLDHRILDQARKWVERSGSSHAATVWAGFSSITIGKPPDRAVASFSQRPVGPLRQ